MPKNQLGTTPTINKAFFFTFPFWKIGSTTCDLKLSALLAILATINVSQEAQKSIAYGRHSGNIRRDLVEVMSSWGPLSWLSSPQSSCKARSTKRFFVSVFHTVFLFLICLPYMPLMFICLKKYVPDFFISV